MASPFLHATILILEAETISFDSILKEGFLTMNVHTSSQRRYVWRWPWCVVVFVFVVVFVSFSFSFSVVGQWSGFLALGRLERLERLGV